MKRSALIRKLRKAAKDAGLSFRVTELPRHSAITIGDTTRTLGRHVEIDEVTAAKYFAQFQEELGRGWWRK